jgi:hypothetical protein
MIHFTIVNAPLSTMNLPVWATGECENGWDYCRLYMANDVWTLLDIVCKKTDKIYGEFGLDLGYYFSTPHLVMDLIIKISKDEIFVYL